MSGASDGVQLAFRETSGAGSEPHVRAAVPLVLLHAFPLDCTMWIDAADALGEATRVVLLDLPGMGGSPLPAGEPSLDAAADGVAGVLDRIGAQRAVLAGVSMGGYVAMAFARRHPDRLAGLALIDTRTAADSPDAARARIQMAVDVVGDTGSRVLLPMLDKLLGGTTRTRRPHLVNRVRDALLSAPPQGVAWSQRAMAARPDSADTVAGVRVPVSVLVGVEDSITGVGEATAMARGIPDAVLVEIPGAGHLSPLERPDAVARALFELLHRVERARTGTG